MKKKTLPTKKIKPVKRDFVKEYEEILEKAGVDFNSIEFEWQEGIGHIKKFSLLKKTPTPILTSHTFSKTA